MEQVPSSGNTAVRNELDRDARWLLIGRILSSASFRRAGRLQDLLRYIAELSILGQTADLTEQRIGEAVFGRFSGYSRVEDSSVRVHMRQLRLKLHEYFDSEGRERRSLSRYPREATRLPSARHRRFFPGFQNQRFRSRSRRQGRVCLPGRPLCGSCSSRSRPFPYSCG
jgi:hypothetical protein